MPGIPDEFIGRDGKPRASWRNFLNLLDADDSERSLAAADRRIRDIGVSYRVHGETGERAWPMSRLPLLIEESDWKEIVAGVAQRASVIEALLADVYGAGRLVGDGVLPAAVVAGSRDYLRPMVDMKPPGGRWMNIYAADLGRGPDGRWWVLGDRAQAPSGAGYALENRLVLSRAWPARYRSMNVERLAPFFRAFRFGWRLAERSQPRICLLTPGPYSETYFEQAYLARYLGFLLVEGDDLVVHQGAHACAHHRGPQARRRDLAARRFRFRRSARTQRPVAPRRAGPAVGHASRPHRGLQRAGLGICGIARADEFHAAHRSSICWVRNCACRISRPGGAAIARRSATCSRISIRWRLRARSPITFRASRPISRSCRPIFLPPSANALAEAVEARGLDFVGQEVVRLSTAPVWNDGQLVPRPFVLRVFATATPDGWRVMPGGFCRISARPDARAVSMGEGVQSADVWVLSSKPVVMETLLPATDEVKIRRILGNLPSRAADNLFWLGRYLERAEATLASCAAFARAASKWICRPAICRSRWRISAISWSPGAR